MRWRTAASAQPPYSEHHQSDLTTHRVIQSICAVLCFMLYLYQVDISTQRSKLVSTLLDEQHVVFQYVITVCDNAAQQCPAFPGRAKVCSLCLHSRGQPFLHLVSNLTESRL